MREKTDIIHYMNSYILDQGAHATYFSCLSRILQSLDIALASNGD